MTDGRWQSGNSKQITLLGEAVAAYRAALTVRAKTELPVDWAQTNENLAIASLALANLDAARVCEHLNAAKSYVENSLQVYSPEHMPYNWGTATELLTKIDARIAECC